MKSLLSRLSEGLSEYFLGTKTKEYYENHNALIGENLANEHANVIINSNNVYSKATRVMGKYIPNFGDVLSIGSLIGYFVTKEESYLLRGIIGLAGSEVLRFLVRRLDLSNRDTDKEMINFLKTMESAKDSVKQLVDKVKEDKLLNN